MRFDADFDVKRYDVRELTDPELDLLRAEDARAIHAMWDALRAGRAAPFRAELDAAKIGRRAPFLAIFERVDAGNFRIRIAGDRLNRWFGLELRGMSALSLVEPAGRNHLQALLNRVTDEPAAAAAHGVARARDGYACPFEFVLLPMRSDFGPVDRVLYGFWLLEAEPRPTGPLRLDLEETIVASVAPPAAQDADGESAIEADAAPAAAAAPAFTAVEGGGAATGPARRGHLKLVKTDTPQRRK